MEDTEIEDYMNATFRESKRNILEKLISYEFPQLKNIKILDGEGENFIIQFDEGSVSGEEILNKINEYKKWRELK